MNKETEILLKCQRVVDSCKTHQKEMAQRYIEVAYHYLCGQLKPRLLYMGLPDPYKSALYYNFFKQLKRKLENVQNNINY